MFQGCGFLVGNIGIEGRSLKWAGTRKVLKQDGWLLPQSATNDTNAIFVLFFQDSLLESFIYPLAISLQVSSSLLTSVIWPLFTSSH